MKLLHLNIWSAKLARQILELIEAEQPDILCLQEAFDDGGHNIRLPDDPGFNFLDKLPALGYDHIFFAPALGISCNGYKLEFGNAIVSRFPIRNQEISFIFGEYSDKWDPAEVFPNVRNMQLATIENGDQSCTIANHHGYWLADPMGDQTSIDCMRKVADKLRKVQGPLVFAGDLNLVASSPAMRVFDGFLEDLTATYNLTTTLSQLGKVADVACDHAFVSPDIKVSDFRTSDALVSDHKALILEFNI